MRSAARLIFLAASHLILNLGAAAQIAQPALPVQLDGDPRPTQVLPNAIFRGGQCDSSGVLYLSYAVPAGDSYTATIAKIAEDGGTETVALQNLPNLAGAHHTFAFAAASDGSLHEVLRAATPGARDNSTQVDYVRFDPDGAVRSDSAFAQEFVPSVLLPLPSGNFFAAGVVMHQNSGAVDGVTESALVGIFDSDARLQQKVRWETKPGKPGPQDSSDEEMQGQTARLGGDGDIYFLLAGDHAKVAVIDQTGRMRRVLKLKEPFENGVVTDMWVSGGRVLVSYEGETDDPKDAYVYVMYDAQSGEVVRQYKPEFAGTPACFEDGQTLSVLVRKPATGAVGIATAELQ